VNVFDRELQAILHDEAKQVRPPDGAKERGWARLMAAVQGGEGGPGEGGPLPAGAIRAEVRRLIAIARCEAGQTDARRAGETFARTHPDSLDADRVRTACKL